ncbi:MAG: GNAT family N-acetyltransferase, partial [Terriglobales bacterium]
QGDLGREHRRLAQRWEAAGVALRQPATDRERLELLQWLLEQKRQACTGRGEHNALGTREQAWLEAMVAQERTLAELWSLTRGGERAAALLCWRTAAVRYGYTIGYNPRMAALSPGVLVLFAVLRQTMKEGRAFNFLTGEQAYKLRFATHRDVLLRFRHAD